MDEEKGEEGKTKDDVKMEPVEPPEGVVPDLKITGIESLNAETKKLLGKKRGKKGRRIPIHLGEKKEKKVRNPTDYQRLLDKIEKLPVITRDTIQQAAKDMNYNIDKDNLDFFNDIGQAKVALKKFGLPSGICKVPFHLICDCKFFLNTLGEITDDKLVIESILSYNFGSGKKYEQYINYCKFSKNYKFSFVTNSVMKFDGVTYGYIQDFFSDIAVISNRALGDEDFKEVEKVINEKRDGSIGLLNYGLLDNTSINFFKFGYVILAGNKTLEQLLALAKEIKVFNSKNKFKDSFKEIKINGEYASYINVIDKKVTDFSPSTMFWLPVVKNYTLIIEGDLDLNTIYNMATKELHDKTLADISLLGLPPNAIFWDNIESYVQLLGLINSVNPPALSGQIVELMELFYSNRDVIKGWKTVYKLFENIIISFYDSVTTKLTIDGITKLENKTIQFIAYYNQLKKDATFDKMKKIIELIPNPVFMRNFALTNIPLEIVHSLSKLISILKVSKVEENMDIVELFRSIGIYCTRVFINGQYEMIPKIRSPAAFLGGVAGEMSNETLRDNVNYLLSSYKEEEKKVKKIKTDISYEDMDKLIDFVLDNSSRNLDDNFISDNFKAIKEKVKSDGVFWNSLRTEIETLLEEGATVEEIKANYDFLENPIFANFLIGFKQIEKAVRKKKKGKLKARDIIAAIKIDAPTAKKLLGTGKARAFKSLGRKRLTEKKDKKKVSDLKQEKVIKLDKDAVVELQDNVDDGVVAQVEEDVKEIVVPE